MPNNKKSIIMLHKIIIPAKELNRSHCVDQLSTIMICMLPLNGLVL